MASDKARHLLEIVAQAREGAARAARAQIEIALLLELSAQRRRIGMEGRQQRRRLLRQHHGAMPRMRRAQLAGLLIVAPFDRRLIRIRLPVESPAQPEAQAPFAQLDRGPAEAQRVGLRLAVAEVEFRAGVRQAQRDLLAPHRARSIANRAALRRKIGEGVLAGGIGDRRQREAARQLAHLRRPLADPAVPAAAAGLQPRERVGHFQAARI